jgi:hypothetical protein
MSLKLKKELSAYHQNCGEYNSSSISTGTLTKIGTTRCYCEDRGWQFYYLILNSQTFHLLHFIKSSAFFFACLFIRLQKCTINTLNTTVRWFLYKWAKPECLIFLLWIPFRQKYVLFLVCMPGHWASCTCSYVVLYLCLHNDSVNTTYCREWLNLIIFKFQKYRLRITKFEFECLNNP